MAWPGGRLTVVAPFAAERIETTDPQAAVGIWTGRVDTFVDHGTNWSADVVSDHVLIGLPEANSVAAVSIEAPGELGEDSLFNGEGRFGEIVRSVTDARGISVWVGAPQFDLARGAVVRHRNVVPRLLGETSEGAGERDLTIVGGSPNDGLGDRITVCPDADEDGHPEVILGAPDFEVGTQCGGAAEAPPSLSGAVFVLRSAQLEAASGIVPVCELADVLWGTQLGEQAGAAIACDREAFYVGAPWFGLQDDERPNAGRVFRVPWAALPEGASRLGAALPEVGTIRPSDHPEDGFGAALAAFDRDGEAALLVGAPGFESRRGRAVVLTADATFAVEQTRIVGEESGEQFGRAVLAGDLDGDGVDDVAIGSPDFFAPERLDMGQLWLWRSASVTAWAATGVERASADQIIAGTHAFQRVGRKLSRTTAKGRPVLLIPTRADPAPR